MFQTRGKFNFLLTVIRVILKPRLIRYTFLFILICNRRFAFIFLQVSPRRNQNRILILTQILAFIHMWTVTFIRNFISILFSHSFAWGFACTNCIFQFFNKIFRTLWLKIVIFTTNTLLIINTLLRWNRNFCFILLTINIIWPLFQNRLIRFYSLT